MKDLININTDELEYIVKILMNGIFYTKTEIKKYEHVICIRVFNEEKLLKLIFLTTKIFDIFYQKDGICYFSASSILKIAFYLMNKDYKIQISNENNS